MRTLPELPSAEDKVQAVKHGLLASFQPSGVHVSHRGRTEGRVVPALLPQTRVLSAMPLHLTSQLAFISASAPVSPPVRSCP